MNLIIMVLIDRGINPKRTFLVFKPFFIDLIHLVYLDYNIYFHVDTRNYKFT